MTTVPLRPLLLDASISHTEARFTVQQGRALDLVCPVPAMVGMVERGTEVDVDILTPEGVPLYGFSIDRSTPAGSDLLTRLCTELVQPQP